MPDCCAVRALHFAPHSRHLSRRFHAASAWWVAGRSRTPFEADVLVESDDGKALLVGEAEWSDKPDLSALAAELRRKAEDLPLRENRTLVLDLWFTRTEAAS